MNLVQQTIKIVKEEARLKIEAEIEEQIALCKILASEKDFESARQGRAEIAGMKQALSIIEDCGKI